MSSTFAFQKFITSSLFGTVAVMADTELSLHDESRTMNRWASDPLPEPPVKPLTRDEARALRRRLGTVSPWRVVAVQAVAGIVCSVVLGLFTRQPAIVWSALYGAGAIVLPNVLMARGATRRTNNPMAAAVGLLVWEMLKIGAAIAMLVIAAKVVPRLSWPALLATMVVCIKVNWFALLWRGRIDKTENR